MLTSRVFNLSKGRNGYVDMGLDSRLSVPRRRFKRTRQLRLAGPFLATLKNIYKFMLLVLGAVKLLGDRRSLFRGN